MNAIPVPNQNFKIEEIDGETLLYHLGQTKTVYLNESATIIWQLCDGKRSIKDIVAMLQSHYPDQADSIENDVSAAIDQFVEEGAVELSTPSESTGAA